MDADRMMEARAPYGAAYYRDQQTRSRRSAAVIVPLMLDLVRPRSVVDIGCGVGAWVELFRELSVERHG